MSSHFKKLVKFTLMLSLFISGCGDSQDKQKSPTDVASLTMGTSADNPPFESYLTGESETQIVGFDIDLAKALGKALNVEIKIKDMDFSALVPALQAGRVDFVMAAMTLTQERKKNIDFSTPYLSLSAAVLTMKDQSISSAKELSGKKVGVQLGSTYEQLAKDLAQKDPSITLMTLNKLGELVQQLTAGRIDAVLTDSIVAESYAKSAANLKMNLLPEEKVDFAIAFAKGSPLPEKFNKAIDEFMNSEQFLTLKKKWFPQN